MVHVRFIVMLQAGRLPCRAEEAISARGIAATATPWPGQTVCTSNPRTYPQPALLFQKLAGASLLVFANKQDLPGALSAEEIAEVAPTVGYHTMGRAGRFVRAVS
jgi:hypothetical protein